MAGGGQGRETMNHKITHAYELAKVIRERFNSGEWWIWVPVGWTGGETLLKIEKAFYWNEANVDFDVTFFPDRFLFVALGKKSRATAGQLERLLNKGTKTKVKITSKTDVMFLVADDDETGKTHAMNALAALFSSYFPDLN